MPYENPSPIILKTEMSACALVMDINFLSLICNDFFAFICYNTVTYPLCLRDVAMPIFVHTAVLLHKHLLLSCDIFFTMYRAWNMTPTST